MALVSNGPHTVLVHIEEEVTDWRGNIVRRPRADSPVTVTGCWMQPMASTRGAFAALKVDEGQDVSVAYKLIARTAPVGWWSRVEWTHLGVTRKFAVLGGPLERNYGTPVSHISVTLQEER
jgi:hypothetical protein